MSPYTTMHILRKDAEDYAIKGITDKLREIMRMSDEDLGDLLDDLYKESTLYNYLVVDSFDDDEWSYKFGV